ncbi:hypothetical protein PCCS19_05900 [Paenibacillus sp. CCS19]|uniref:hypothetical protein n=1 Tax=Paenibacillus sp. CCS19 TaxID=3158387 RepID=UPI002566F54E|nr:hypothetical protein [Paenibacillus cellulosilyticus]GMK37536.1 hypothetical protein PCCS19_05900 [Paenibacillus cellulosilyticus]
MYRRMAHSQNDGLSMKELEKIHPELRGVLSKAGRQDFNIYRQLPKKLDVNAIVPWYKDRLQQNKGSINFDNSIIPYDQIYSYCREIGVEDSHLIDLSAHLPALHDIVSSVFGESLTTWVEFQEEVDRQMALEKVNPSNFIANSEGWEELYKSMGCPSVDPQIKFGLCIMLRKYRGYNGFVKELITTDLLLALSIQGELFDVYRSDANGDMNGKVDLFIYEESTDRWAGISITGSSGIENDIVLEVGSSFLKNSQKVFASVYAPKIEYLEKKINTWLNGPQQNQIENVSS